MIESLHFRASNPPIDTPGEPITTVPGEPLNDGKNHAYREDDTVRMMLNNRSGPRQTATIDADAWERVKALSWRVDQSGYVIAERAPGRVVTLARIITDAPAGNRVRFIDSNPLNRRASNLRAVATCNVRPTRPRRMKNAPLAVARETELDAPGPGESFRPWLVRQTGRADTIGTLARLLEAVSDPPVCWAPHVLGPFMIERGLPNDMIFTLRRAHDRFLALRKNAG